MIVRKFVELNVRASKYLNGWLPEKFDRPGTPEFVKSVVPRYASEGLTIYDVGGGKRPFFSTDAKQRLKARVIGIDLSADELNQAEPGAYDQIIVSPIEQVVGEGDGDLVICKTVLEHVADTAQALRAIHSLLKPGGHALIMVPSRNAAFARLNLMLPEKLKRAALYAVFPRRKNIGGFRAFYDRCTPRDFCTMADETGFTVAEEQHFYWASYYGAFLPAYLVWRTGSLIYYGLAGRQAAEAFILALEKQAETNPDSPVHVESASTTAGPATR